MPIKKSETSWSVWKKRKRWMLLDLALQMFPCKLGHRFICIHHIYKFPSKQGHVHPLIMVHTCTPWQNLAIVLTKDFPSQISINYSEWTTRSIVGSSSSVGAGFGQLQGSPSESNKESRPEVLDLSLKLWSSVILDKFLSHNYIVYFAGSFYRFAIVSLCFYIQEGMNISKKKSNIWSLCTLSSWIKS